MSLTPSTSNAVTVPVSDNDTNHMDIELIVAQAQEQKEWIWVEEDQKTQKEEWSNVVALDKEAVEKVTEKAVKKMVMIFCQVIFSSDFFGFIFGS